MKLASNKFLIGALFAFGAVASIVFASTSSATVHTTPDCSSNAVIKCGVTSASDLKAKYNSSAELRNIYAHFGWTSSVINNARFVDGIVYADGTVKVAGKTVATGAESIGRNVDSGSGCKGTPFTINGKTYYKGTTKCRFGSFTAQPVLVMLDANGQFIGAINKTCGNPHPAKPVLVPVHTCDLLTANQLSRNEFRFSVKATAKNGATITNYVYDFGDGAKSTSTSASANHTYANAGTYTVTVTVNYLVDGKTVTETSDNCSARITVKPQPPVLVQVCDLNSKQIITIDEKDFDSSKHSKNLDDCKTVPPVTPPTLPHTGISEGLLSVLGVGSLVVSTYYYIASRRGL